MKHWTKLILSIIGILISVGAAIGSLYFEKNILITILCGVAAFIDSFICIVPTMFKVISINSSKIDPNMYYYKKSQFVDRKEIYHDICEQIKNNNCSDNMLWIRIHGESGIGKKTLISKIFNSYKYPKNRFYFLTYENGRDITSLLSEQFPLSNANFKKEIYLRKLSKSKRTFIIIDSNYNAINNGIIQFMSEWSAHASAQHQLVFISYDNDKAQSRLKCQTYIYEYELCPLNHEDSLRYVNVLSPKSNQKINGEIVRFSNGLPATIKFLCDITKKDNCSYNTWQKAFITMRDDLTFKYVQLCTLMLVNNCIDENIIVKILDNEEYSSLINSGRLLLQNDHYVVPIWILNAMRITDSFNQLFVNSIDFLYKEGIIADSEKGKAIILIKKENEDILFCLKHLEINNDYSTIKEYYDKLSLDFSLISNDVQTEILLIFMNALLKLGAYYSFESLIEASKGKFIISPNMNEFDFRYNFLLADYYHLTSNYEISNSIFEALLVSPFGGKRKVELEFSLAHNFRHQGILDPALELFKSLVEQCPKNSVIYKRAITAIVSIEYFKGVYDNKKHLKMLTSLLSDDDTDFNIIRHLSNVYRREFNDYDKAIKLLTENLHILENKNLRIVQDYYFELAECFRFKCNDNLAYYNEAITYYNKALLFAELNHDINLQLCSRIGKSLLMFDRHKNVKALSMQLSSVLSDANKLSAIIEYAIMTILSAINESGAVYQERLKKNKLNHHLLILRSKRVELFHVTVM